MRGFKVVLLAIVVVVSVPMAAFAQGTLSGLVRDASGAVLPGVTVEASSPVLIEKVRSGVTDGTGRYSIPDLRPGTYRLSFSLTGFKTVVRDGVVLSGTSVLSVNADLEVGGLQETITVSGETPAVDLQSTTRQAVMDQEIVSAVPSSRTPFTVGVLIPGVRKGAFTGQDVGGSVVQEVASLEANGGRTSDQRMMVNGVALSSGIAGGWGGGAVPNATGTAEFAIDVSAVDAQAATGGVRINFIPRNGGNRFSGTIFGSFANESFASDNFTGSDVQARGLSVPGTIKGSGDLNPGVGGPILRDKLWFFVSGRKLYADNYVAGMFFNANANNLNRFDYVRSADQAVLHQEQSIFQVNFTWQANQKNKFALTIDQENFCACTTGISATVSPEAGNDRRFPLQRFVTVDWSTPVSNRLLIEASGIHRVERWGGMEPQVGKLGNIDHLTPGMISVTDTPQPGDRRPAHVPGGHAPITTPGTGTSTTGLPCRTSPAPTPSRSASTTRSCITRTRPTARRPCRTAITSPRWCPPPSPTGSCLALSKSTSIAIWGSSYRTSGQPDDGRWREPSALTPSRTASRSSRSSARSSDET